MELIYIIKTELQNLIHFGIHSVPYFRRIYLGIKLFCCYSG